MKNNLGKYYSEEVNRAVMFDSIPLTEEQESDIDYIKDLTARLYQFILSRTNESNTKSSTVALFNLENTVMYAVKAIVQSNLQSND
jgi:hypothetical protein